MSQIFQGKDGHEGPSPEALQLLLSIARKHNESASPLSEGKLQQLISKGWVRQEKEGEVLTHEGRKVIRCYKLAQEEIRVAAKEDQIARGSPISQEAQSMKGQIKFESPLQLLASRKKPDGGLYLTPSQTEAGERLRRDFERGLLVKSLGIDWHRLGAEEGHLSKNARRSRGEPVLGDAALDAQQRFRKAISFLGEEFADPLIDFCCFLKGLEELEKRRNWPSRSGKLIISLGLSRLARHYGLIDETKGPDRNPLRHWGAKDYRPKLS